jgi:uncharacterized MAPEG superfamily protein
MNVANLQLEGLLMAISSINHLLVQKGLLAADEIDTALRVLCLVQIVIASHAASFQRGYKWTASSRDTEVPPLTGVAGRLERALRNFLETFSVFVAAVFLVHVLGRESALSEWGAGLYFSARLVYLLLYASSVPLIRSLVWNIAFAGIALLLLASLWPA